MEDIGWKVQVTPSRSTGNSVDQNLVHQTRDLRYMSCFGRELDEGLDGLHLIEFLEVALAGVGLIAGAGDHDGGPSVGSGVGEPGKAVDAAGAGDGKGDARRPVR